MGPSPMTMTDPKPTMDPSPMTMTDPNTMDHTIRRYSILRSLRSNTKGHSSYNMAIRIYKSEEKRV